MTHPFFYTTNYNSSEKIISLGEDTSRHIVQVLRMKKGEYINLTDGKGNLLITEIVTDNKKECEVLIKNETFIPKPPRKVSIAISLVKNVSRFEWFLEKATELGIDEIIPLICDRTEKQKFRSDRMRNILISSMLQSQQYWLPLLHEPAEYKKAIENTNQQQKMIAHCMNSQKEAMKEMVDTMSESQIVLIGPEGDFTKDEIEYALKFHFVPVALGATRLRTETAGIAAAAVLKLL